MTLQAGIGAGIRVRRELLFAVCLPSVRCALLRAKVSNSLITNAGGGLAIGPAPARLRLQASFVSLPRNTTLEGTSQPHFLQVSVFRHCGLSCLLDPCQYMTDTKGSVWPPEYIT